MGRGGGATRGRDSNLRSNDFGPGKGLLAGVSHLPAMIPVITGIALAFQLRREERVAIGWCGDGAAARGDMHESMNLAGVRRLPIVYIIDNNQYAYSTPNRLSFACEHLADRGPAYGFEGIVVDGTDVVTVYREAQRAIEKAREGGGPTIIELITLRMEGHAVHDDAGYVPRELLAEFGSRTRSSASAPGWPRSRTAPTTSSRRSRTRCAGGSRPASSRRRRARSPTLQPCARACTPRMTR